MPRLTSRRFRRRDGFTLIELLIAGTLLAIVGFAITNVMRRQQRFYTNATALAGARRELRTGLSLLPADIRSISSVGGDITAMRDSVMEFRATIGSSIICSKAANKLSMVIPPTSLSNEVLTFWYTPPQAGDSVFVLNDGNDPGAVDDSWVPLVIAADPTADAVSSCAPFVNVVLDPPVTRPRWNVTFTTAIPDSVHIGNPVRFVRHVRYSLFQNSAQEQWYLGFRDYQGGAWSSVQPIGGPFRAYAATGTSGIGFRYFDSLGVQLTDVAQASRVARVDVTLNALGPPIKRSGLPDSIPVQDSLAFRIAVRNRQ